MKLNNNDDSHNSGLNLLIYNMLLDIESHPAWVCGLKLIIYLINMSCTLSHPAWVCGLKLKSKFGDEVVSKVTPCVGVWIETNINFLSLLEYPSHPAWVCGLKQLLPYQSKSLFKVTPCVGVWIETCMLLGKF